MSRVAVLGASIAGLYSALALSRDGHDVVVFERDPAPPVSRDDAALGWDRPGTPQFRHSHTFVCRAVHLLRAEHPGLYTALLASGGHEVRLADHLPPWVEDRAPRGADDELVALSVRRPVFDWTLHSYALGAGVVVDRTGVTGFTFASTNAAVPHVTGLVLADGRTYAADVVVDASGRRTRTPSWLADAGAAPLPESASPCGNRYYTRYYELLPGAKSPGFQRGFASGGELDACMVLVFRGDGDTFSVSIQTEDHDDPLRALRDPRAFHAAAALAPWAAGWLDPSVSRPLNDPAVMAGQQNLLRRSVSDGAPVATGVLLVGDAAATSNPTYGRGVSLALAGAALVRTALAVSDPGEQVLALDAAMTAEVEPYVVNSQEVDARTLARWRHRLYGEPEPSPPDGVTYEDVILTAMRDRDTWQSLMRTVGLLQRPDVLLADPRVVTSVEACRASGWLPPMPPVPDRDELLATVAAATA